MGGVNREVLVERCVLSGCSLVPQLPSGSSEMTPEIVCQAGRSSVSDAGGR